MAIFDVRGPNGKVYSVQAPEGTPTEAIQRMAFRAYKQDQETAYLASIFREDPSLVDNIFGGLGAGAVSGTATGLEGAAALLSDEGEAKARELIAKGRDAMMPTDVDPDSWAYKLSSGIGSMAPLIAAGLIPGVGLPAAAGVGISMGAGEARNRAMEAGVTGDELGSKTLQGGLVGSLEVLPLARMLKVLRVPAPSAIERLLTPRQTEGIRQWIIERAKTGGIEAAQEGASNILQNMIEQGYNPDQETFEGTAEEAAIGGAAGAIIDALIPGRGAGSVRNRPDVEGGADRPEDLVGPPAPPSEIDTDGAVEAVGDIADEAAARRAQRQAGVLERENRRARERADLIAEQRARGASSRQLARELDEDQLDMLPDELRVALEPLVGPERQRAAEPEMGDAQMEQYVREAKARQELEENPPEQLTIDDQIAQDEEAELEQMAAQEQAALRDAEETRQIEEMVAADEVRAEQDRAERQRLETLSAIETLDRQRDREREQGYEARRREILEGLISDPAFPTMVPDDVLTAARDRLSEAGFGRPEPTEQESATLLRAKEIADAQRPEPEAIPEDPEAAQNAEMEAAIPERSDVREPNQPPLPGIEGRGMAQRRGLTVPEEAPEPPAPPPIIDDDYLDNLSIPRSALVRRRLLDKNLADATDRADVLGDLENLRDILQRQSPEAEALPAVQREIDYLNNLDATAYDGDVRQGEMFGPRGGINPQARVKTPKRKQQPAEPAPAEEVSEATETEVAEAPTTNEATEEQVAEQQVDEVTDDAVSETNEPEQAGAGRGPRRRARSAERQPADQVGDTSTEAADTGRSGLASNQPDDADAGVREGTDGGSLTEAEPKPAAKKSEPKAEPKPVAKKAEPKAEQKPAAKKAEPKKQTPKTKVVSDYDSDMGDVRSRVGLAELGLDRSWAYTSSFPNDPTTQTDYETLLEAFTPEVRSNVESLVPQIAKDTVREGAREQKISKLTPEEAAYSYFMRRVRPIDALRDLVHDLVFITPVIGNQQNVTKGDKRNNTDPKESQKYRTFMALANHITAKKAAKWVSRNMSGRIRREFQKMLRKEAAWAINISTNAKLVEKRAKTNDALAGETNVRGKLEEAKNGPLIGEVVNVDPATYKEPEDRYVDEDTELDLDISDLEQDFDDLSDIIDFKKSDAAAMDIPLPPGADGMLNKGDIVSALRAIGYTNPNPRISDLAHRIANTIGDNVNVIVAKPSSAWGKLLKDNDADGMFIGANSKTKVSSSEYVSNTLPTIVLSAETGLNTHTVMHEAAHAVLKQALKNKNSNVVKRLQKIFDDVKDQLPTAYGSTNLDEFASEFISNSQFRSQVAALRNREGEFVLKRILKDFGDLLARALGYQSWGDMRTEMMLKKLMAPTPKDLDAGIMRMLSAANNENSRNVIQRTVDYWSADNTFTKAKRDEYADQVIDMVTTKPKEMGILGLMKFMQFQSIADVARKSGIYSVEKIYDALDKMSGDITEVNKQLDAAYNGINSAFQGRDRLEKIREYSEFENKATVYQVDPTLSSWDARQKYKGDEERLDVWAELNETWTKWGKEKPQYQDVWHKLRRVYADLLEDLKDSLLGKIDASIDDPTVRTLIKEKISKELLNNASIEPYAPLFRKGDYWISFNSKAYKGQRAEPHVMAFETANARNRYIAELKQNPEAVDVDSLIAYPKDNRPRWDKAPAGSFVHSLLKDLEKAEFKTEVDKQETIFRIMELYTDSLPESSFARSLKRRENTPGYRNDVLETFKHRAYGMAGQIQRMKSSSNLYTLLDKFREEVREWGMKSSNAQIKDPKAKRDANGRPYISEPMRKALETEVAEAVNFATNPPTDLMARLAPQLNRVAYMGTLGFNVSSAVLQLAQLPMVAVPYMVPKTNLTTVMRSMNTGIKLFSGAGRTHKVLQYGSDNEYETVNSLMPSIDNYYVVDKDGNWSIRDDLEGMDDRMPNGMTRREVAQEIIPLVKEASERGLMNRSMLYESMGLEDGGRGHSVSDRVSSMAAGMHHTAERFNRQALMVANYFNEMARMDANPTAAERAMSPEQRKAEAVKIALYDTIQVNGGAALQVAPSISKKGLMRVAMMFKPYGFQMYYHQFKMAREAMARWEKGATPEQKAQGKVALQQLVGTQAMVALMSGVQGLTLYGIFSGLWDFVFKDDDEPDLDTIVRQQIGEGPWKGVINYLTGTDIAARIGLSNLILQGNKYTFDPSVEKSIVSTLGGPFYGYVSQIIRGVKDISDGEYQRGMENVLPAAFRNVARTARYMQDDGITTRRGDMITGDLGPGNLLAQVVGFAPAEYTRQMELNMIRKGIDREVGEKRTMLLRKYYVALRVGDFEGAQDAMDDIVKFNTKWPTWGIDAETVKRSMAQHRETSATGMFGGITINPALRSQLLMMGEDGFL